MDKAATHEFEQLSQQLKPIITNPFLTDEDAELLARAKVHEFLEERSGRGELLVALMRAVLNQGAERELLERIRTMRNQHK
jgi:hypothetical protein